jgi:hypothetical protein
VGTEADDGDRKSEGCGGVKFAVIDNKVETVDAPQIAPSPAPVKDVRF